MNEALEKLNRLRQDVKKLKKWKPPREWAQEVCNLETLEERRKKLDEVPEDFRHWVKFYVTQYFMRRKR